MNKSERAAAAMDDGFVRFFAQKLHPAINRVGEHRRAALKKSLFIAACVFLVFLAGVYAFFAPYNEILGEHKISYWPLLILLPATMSVIAFSLVYILSLRTLVGDFRNALMERMAEYIDVGVTHASGKAFAASDIADSLLFEEGSRTLPGQDRFRGQAGSARIEFTELRVLGKDRDLDGVFSVAHFDKRFSSLMLVLPHAANVDMDALATRLRATGFAHEPKFVRLDNPVAGTQVLALAGGREGGRVKLSRELEEMLAFNRERRGVELYLSFRNDTLWAALLAPREKSDRGGVCDGFDLVRCREFCIDAALCLQLARELDADVDLLGN